MPSWKKVITSGSDASVNSIFVANAVTSSIFSGSRYIGTSFTGSLFGTASWANNALTSSNIQGGTANYIPIWSTATSLGNSSLYESSGNVGIGTTLPSAYLDIKGASDTAGVISLQLRSGNTSTNFSSSQITFAYANTNLYRHAIKTRHNAGASAGNAIDFYTWLPGSATTDIGGQHVMSLNGANVGIGTTTPLVKLDVSGSVAVAGTDGLRIGAVGDNSAYDNVKVFYSGFNAGAPRIYLTPRTTPGSGIVSTYFHLLNSNGSSTTSNNTMGLLVDGSVGIGTTSPSYKLHVSGGSQYIEGGFGTNTATAYTSTNRLIFNNDYSDSARGPNKITLYDSSWLGGFGVHSDSLAYYSGGTHRWYQATTAINATHLMTLNNLGNLGIGTTTPAARLDVVGSTRIIGATTISGSFTSTGTFSLQRIQPVGGNSRQIVITSDSINAGNTSTANNIVLIGPFAGSALTGTGADSMISLGINSGGSITTGGSYSIFIGRNSGGGITTGIRNVIISSGDQTNIPSSTSNAIHIIAGGGYEGNDANIVLGGETSQYAFIGGGSTHPEYTRRFYFGGGGFVSTPQNANIDFYAPSATGSTANLQGSNFTINAGRGTGTGTPGDFIVATSSTGSSGLQNQTLASRFWVKGATGNIGVGTSSPSERIETNGSVYINAENSGFIVDASGNKRIGFMKYSGREAGLWRTGSGQDFEVGRILSGSLTAPITFTTDLYIDGNGNVGINTSSPSSKLAVSGSIQAYVADAQGTVSISVGEGTTGATGNLIALETNSTTNTTRIYNSGTSTSLNIGSTGATSDVSLSSVRDVYFKVNNAADVFAGTTAMYISSSANVGIGTTTPAFPLDVNGTARVTTLIETSTKLLKDNIEPYSTDIKKFKKIQPVSFTWKDTKKEDVGIIAEDLNKIFPEFVSKDNDGKAVGIHYGKLATIFINVIKEQQERIELLEKQVKKLIK